MKKAEKITELQAQFLKVGTPVLVNDNTDMSLKQYDIPVVEPVTGRGTTIPISVIHEGDTEKEECLCPKDSPDTAWHDTVTSKVAGLVNSGDIVKGIISNINNDEKFAIVDAYKADNGTVSNISYFIYDDGNAVQIKGYNG